MNVSAIILFATAFLATVSALPTLEDLHHQELQIKVHDEADIESPFTEEDFVDTAAEQGVRFRRATCDLLSFDTKFGSLNHSACAAHCLAMRKGYRGGRCRDGVCHCRR